MASIELTHAASVAGDRYLLLADISGYTAFMASVERAHGVDFGAGIPAGDVHGRVVALAPGPA